MLLPSFAAGARQYGFRGTAALAGGYNNAWGAYAGADLGVKLSAGDFLEAGADFEGLSSGTFSFGLSARPKLTFDAGTLYLDTGVLYRLTGGGSVFDFVTQGSLGWKMKHLDLQLGLYSRTFGSLSRDNHSLEERVGEPFNVLYRIQFNLKGPDALWDLWGGITDFSAYEFERHWAPYAYLGGRRSFGKGLDLFLQAEIKPAGMFHLNASFYGITTRLGAAYKF